LGKGIYDVDAFETAFDPRGAGSAWLSHHLLEGTFARADVVSDTAVVETFPSRRVGSPAPVGAATGN